MKKVFKVILIIIVIFALGIAGFGLYITSGLDKGAQVSVNTVDPALLADGVYQGRYEAGRWTNEVRVTIENQKIIKIEIVKDVQIAKEGLSDELFSKVIAKQNTDVDAVSGGTVTCKAYLKSIEDALNK